MEEAGDRSMVLIDEADQVKSRGWISTSARRRKIL
jgi:hypothetical protein